MNVKDIAAQCGGGRISVNIDRQEREVSMTRQPGGAWFWCVYDRERSRVVGCGHSQTIEGAVEGVRRVQQEAAAGLERPSQPQPAGG
jgi:hypothetical protein